MVVIYYVSDNSSARTAMNWFEKYHVVYKSRKKTKKAAISIKEIKDMLLLTDNGFEDLIIHRAKLVKKLEERIYELTIEELIEKIIETPTIFKLPIILNEKKIVVGCNENELRCFLQKKYRKTFLLNYVFYY